MTASANEPCPSLSAIMAVHRGEYFLLVFYNKHVCLKHTLDSRSNFMGWQPVGTV